jgi:hypothetical protein
VDSKNISWLSPLRVERLARALIMSTVEKHEIIFDEKDVPESVYILLSGVATPDEHIRAHNATFTGNNSMIPLCNYKATCRRAFVEKNYSH